MATNPHGKNAKIDAYDLREFGVWECTVVESIESWGSMHKNVLHKHDGQLELCFLAEGRRVYVDERRTCVMHGGNVWRNAPNKLHSSMGRPSGSALFYCIDLLPPRRGKLWCGLDYPLAKEAWETLMTLDPSAQPVAGEGLHMCFMRLFEVLQDRNRPHINMAVRAAFNGLLSNYIVRTIIPPKPIEGTERIRKLIERINTSDPREPLEVQKLAKEVGVTTSYFVCAFQRVMGQTPGQYISARRLESAARRIADGVPIKEVTQAYHYDSTQHFTRTFGKYFLETPRRYYLRVLTERAAGVRDLALR